MAPFHLPPGTAQSQVDPLGGELLVALILRDFLADRLDLARPQIFGVALHPVGVTDLVIASAPWLRLPILPLQGSWLNRIQRRQERLDSLDAFDKCVQSFVLH